MPAIYLDGLVERLGELARDDVTLSARIMGTGSYDDFSGKEEEIPF